MAHSPDNSFLGFAVPRKSQENEIRPNDRLAALVYGKDPEFWKGHADYIDRVKRYFNEVHATLGGARERQREFGVPKYVINHGIINITSLVNLLHTSKVGGLSCNNATTSTAELIGKTDCKICLMQL